MVWQVQTKHHLCDPNQGIPRCNCAVAVRSGKDVFLIDFCNSVTIINFPSCEDKVLKVIKTNDRYYKVIIFLYVCYRYSFDIFDRYYLGWPYTYQLQLYQPF